MKIEIREQLFITTDNEGLKSDIKVHLDKPNPDFAKLKRMGYPTQGVSPRIRMYENAPDGRLIAPRGAWRAIKEMAQAHDEPIEFRDTRTVVEPIAVVLKNLEPFWYQTEAVNIMEQTQQGMTVAPCGAGKSVIGCMLIAKIKKPTIIVVHTLELFKQWEEMITKFLSFKGKLGKIGNGKREFGDITIAMIQTLVKLNEREWKELQRRFEIFIGDECHHFGAESYIKLMKKVRSKYNLGLTATPKRKDQKDFIVHNYLGKVIYEISDSDLEMMGRSVTCKCSIVDTNRKYNFTSMNENYIVLGSVIAKDKHRNSIIASKIQEDVDNGKKVLVLVERVVQGKLLLALLRQSGIQAELIAGSVDTDTRTKIKHRMRQGHLDVLVANKQIAAEGLDIPVVDSIHICFWTTNLSLIKQMIGRGRRPFEGKEFCRVWLYHDKILTVETDENFQEVMKDAGGFKMNFSRIIKWLRSQAFSVQGSDNSLDI